MKRSTIWSSLVLLGLALVVGLGAKREDQRDVALMANSASRFLASLSTELRDQATWGFDSDERLRFHFIPPEAFERNGASIKDMTVTQRERAHELLRTGLSQRGYMTAQEIMEAEGILGMLEGEEGQFSRDPQLYYVWVFGTPSTDGTWGWRWEGHHLSLQYTIVDGNITVSSPTFIAANPAEVPSGPRRGMRPLARQEDAGRALLSTLTPEQREDAIIADVAPQNVVAPIQPRVDPLSPVGIGASELTSVQRDLLMDIVHAYTDIMSEDIAALRLAKIMQGGIDDITFGWAGGTLRGELSYFRVQGPTFLIEFDFTQNDPNHIHSGWRDFDGDFGRDVLAEHLRDFPH